MTLLEKLLEIKKAMPYLKKENENKGQGFSYVSSSQVLKIFREKCDELGVMVLPEILEAKTQPTPSGKQLLTELKLRYEFVDVENPDDRFPLTFYAQGADQGEKGVGKALTYGEKYLILKLFNIPTDKDDPDADDVPRSTPRSTEPKPSPKKNGDEAFTKAIDALSSKLTERDGNSNAINMLVQQMGHGSINDIKDSKERMNLVGILMKELHINNLEDLLG